MRLSYILYVLGLIGVLLFASDCSCQKDPVDPQHYWVICNDTAAALMHVQGAGSTVALTNGKDVQLSGQLFDATQWSCPDTSHSPIWIGSGRPIYGTTPIKSFARLGPHAASPGVSSYLPALLLDLPFPAQRAGSESTSLACDPTQPDVIEINHDNASVNRMGTCPFQPKATIAVATRPLQIAITPDGSTALVTSFDNAVNFIDLNSNRVTFTLQTGSSINPNGIAITSDGKTAYITSFAPSGAVVAKIDLGSRSIVSTLLVDAYPQNLVLSPDDSQLFVTFPYENEVGIIDTFTFTMAYSFTVPAPRGIAFNSKGTKAYIASAGNPDNATAGTLVEFNTNNFQIANRYNVGLGPNDVAVLYGDQFVATSNYEGQSISKIDTVSGTVQTVNVNGRPSGISIVH